jgi:hypothetical protein
MDEVRGHKPRPSLSLGCGDARARALSSLISLAINM